MSARFFVGLVTPFSSLGVTHERTDTWTPSDAHAEVLLERNELQEEMQAGRHLLDKLAGSKDEKLVVDTPQLRS